MNHKRQMELLTLSKNAKQDRTLLIYFMVSNMKEKTYSKFIELLESELKELGVFTK